MSRVLQPSRRCVPGPALPGEFVRGTELGGDSHGEWVASVTEHTDVLVGDANGTPCALGIAKALSIVQSRAYLERRAVQLLVPLTKQPGSWRIVTLDFGPRARLHECEFRMYFAFEASVCGLSIKGPYAEVGFALMAPGAEDALFALTVKNAVGFSR